MNVLSLDAGKKHFAYAMLSGTMDAPSVRIERVGKLSHTIDDLRECSIVEQSKKFSDEILQCVGNADILVFERAMQQPGKTSGSAIEYMNVMLGMFIQRSVDRGILTVPVAASTWKPTMKRKVPQFQVESAQIYGLRVKKTANHALITDHEFDAVSIGLWFMTCRLEFPLDIAVGQISEQIASIQEARKENSNAYV